MVKQLTKADVYAMFLKEEDKILKIVEKRVKYYMKGGK
jgi:hypothetical protein